jgi:hypothetical protein
MIPNAEKLKADFNYMNAMSSVEKENKTYTVNQLEHWQKQIVSMAGINKKK